MQDAWPENRQETIVFPLYLCSISNFTLTQRINLECRFSWSICAKRVDRKHTRNQKTSFFNRETHSKGSILSLPWLWWHKVWSMLFCNYGKPIMQDMQHMHIRAQMHNWWLIKVKTETKVLNKKISDFEARIKERSVKNQGHGLEFETMVLIGMLQTLYWEQIQ